MQEVVILTAINNLRLLYFMSCPNVSTPDGNIRGGIQRLYNTGENIKTLDSRLKIAGMIASIEQVSLMSMYEKAFAPVAQILLTYTALFNYGIIPVI